MTELTADLAAAIRRNVRDALAEDVRSGDITAELIATSTDGRARVITREDGVFCGVPWVLETARQVDPGLRVELEVSDGDVVTADQALFYVAGSARSILTAERTMLNFAQLLSGTASAAKLYADRVADLHTSVLDTRKTLPGLRLAQKYAVRCGGADNHRIGLFDAFLIKENHIAAAGSITAAIETAKHNHPDKPVEVEVETLGQLDEAIAAEADIVMLDDFTLEQTREGVERARGKLKLEASGGIDLETIRTVAETGVDYISVGDITKRVVPLDLSMRMID